MSNEYINDFTLDGYIAALDLAQARYRFIGYTDVDFGEPFVIWRHDCDHSLNRALRIAEIEHDRGVQSTYFINPHCHYYNLLEKEQAEIICRIIGLGHDIGLHFDALFHNIESENQLHQLVAQEAKWIGEWFGVEVVAFSFHSPTRFCLSCEENSYGGLINCYAKCFKSQIAYCSDSNGYWRFDRLHDVLASEKFRYLQVLTHPEHWQDRSMYPRERAFRSVYGRASAILARYDAVLDQQGRFNVAGEPARLDFIKYLDPDRYRLLDYLWNSGEIQALFIELWRLHEYQLNMFCKAALLKEWKVPSSEVNLLFEGTVLRMDSWCLFKEVFGNDWQSAVGTEETGYERWITLHDRLVHGRLIAPKHELEEGCAFLCNSIEAMMAWGKALPMGYDGISHLDSIEITTNKTSGDILTERLEGDADEIPDFSKKRWNQLKDKIIKVYTGEETK
ncbi:hypothetical protein [Sedimenticola hydrogenitrophicus]|uniref:hypothetical protein n=1 Tax=Sedimenticola hydrogenitrophicus TaxID=2967975 RepID=UPI0021A5EA93|nr:hypothetical protein [Sedimenticola hydrogenitrophicus]